MSTTEVAAPRDEPARETTQYPPEKGAFRALALRLHFYAGLFVGPFLLIAALTGALYAISPTVESFLDRDLLYSTAEGPPRPLSEQVSAGVAVRPDLPLVAVAPAPPGETTRVLFSDPGLGESERRAVFVDPVTARPVGESVVYGSSGALPVRAWISQAHRHLHLGEPGRLYSELAASWLWLIAGAGLVLWIRRVRARRRHNSVPWLFVPDPVANTRIRRLNRHAATGTWILPVLLLLSATGLTWSTYAGANIEQLRENLSWTTPAVDTALPQTASPDHAGHTGHHGEPAAAPTVPAARIGQLDGVLAAARDAGVTQPAEIAIPGDTGAFAVKELRRSGTYTVDAVAVDGATGTVTDRLPYSEWNLMARLANWGIQLHMGLMFGLPNQLVLLAAMIGMTTVIVRGYRMWWQRRPASAETRLTAGRPPRRGVLRRSLWLAVPVLVVAALIGWFAPVFGLSLLGFLIVDVLVGRIRRPRRAA